MRALASVVLLAVLTGAATMSDADAIEFAVPIGFSAGHGRVGPGRSLSWNEVKAAIDASNRSRAVAGLEPVVDPEIIDAAKVRALMQALSGFSAAALAPVEGAYINLNHAGLMVGTAQPTSAAAFGEVTRIELDRAAGKRADIGTDVAVDCGRAMTNASSARAASARFDDEVRALVTAGAAPVARSQAQTRRFRAAQAWRLNARHAVACNPGNGQADSDLKAAEAAVKEWLVAPQGGGMPAN